MSEVLYRATKYMNAEDALSAREDKLRKREKDREMPGRTTERRNQERVKVVAEGHERASFDR